MKLSQLDLAMLAEALNYRLETEEMGDYPEIHKGDNEFTICSKSHETALRDLADRVVANQEATQDNEKED